MDYYRRPLRRKKKSRRIFLILLIVIVILGGGAWYVDSRYEYYLATPVKAGDTTNISFVVKKGDSVSTIAQNLVDKDLILDGNTFEWYNRLNNTDRKIISGRFELTQAMTIPEIVAKITDKTKSQAVVTIPEGSTIAQIDEKLVAQDLIQPGEFIQAVKTFNKYDKYPFLDEKKMKALSFPLEGYLFPDTYFLDPNNFHSEDLIDLMLKDFKKRVTDKYQDQISQSDKSLYDIVTMASIVEKEVNTDKDRPIVAGILWKRLKEHWVMGADATLLYLKQDRTIDFQDLQEDSPYNTRKFQGLPPGPIGNPGVESIEAALNPEDSPYYFYLNRPDTGEVVYARTNDEHNANKRKYLQ